MISLVLRRIAGVTQRRRELERCHEVTEQARRKVAGVGEWVDRSPQDRAEVVSVRVAGTKSPILLGSHAIKRLARSVERL